MFKSLRRMSTATLVAATFALGLMPATPNAQDYGGVALIGAQADGSSIGYPPTMRRTTDFLPAVTALETLVRYDESGVPTPWLALSWEEDADAKTIVLELRPGVAFHDGTALDAEAVKWNFEQFIASDRPDLKAVDSIDVIDDLTLRLNLTDYDNTIIGSLAGTPGLMISRAAFEANGGAEWAEKNPVGTGPFSFVSWDKDIRQVYEKFDGYWQDGKPYLDGVEWVFVADAVTLMSALQTGEVHVYTEISPADALPFIDNDDYVINRAGVGVGGFGILFDSLTEDSPFANLTVRQATLHAIDTRTIVERLTRGLFDFTNQLVAENHWAYNPDLAGYPFDPDRARALLAEAGYPDGFSTTLTSWNSPPLTVDAFTAVQGFLADVGIDAELKLIDRGQLGEIVVGGTWEGLMWAAPGAPNPDAIRAFIADLSDRSPLWKLVEHPAAYEAELAAATATADFETKRQHAFEAQRLFFQEHALMIPLWSRADLALKSSALRDEGLFALNRTQWNPADAWLAQ